MKLWRVLFCATVVAALAATTAASTFSAGDVFVSLRNGTVREYTPTGTLVQTLNTGRTGELTGSAFDSSGNFYVTAGFAGGGMVKFDNNGTLLGAFGTGYAGQTESVLFDSAGTIWNGQAGTNQINHQNSTGTSATQFTVATQNRGTDWIDLSADQHTMFYTSEGSKILRYDTATSTQLTAFTTLGSEMFALRLLSNGSILAANANNVLLFDSSGNIAHTYLPGSGLLFALNLDPNGTDFWTAEYSSGQVYEINIATGAVDHTFNVGQGISGLSVFGERTVSTPVPEPGTFSLLLLGGASAFTRIRKRLLRQ